MSGRPAPTVDPTHLAGIVYAVLLAAACWFAVDAAAWLLSGTIARELGNLAAFAVVVAVLTLGDILWPWLKRWTDGRRRGTG